MLTSDADDARNMDRQALVLLLTSHAAADAGQKFPLDRIRLQKAVFLATKRGALAWRDLYPYEPYNWGPYSSTLSREVDELEARGQLTVSPWPGNKYGTFTLTQLGEGTASGEWAKLSVQEADFLKKVCHFVTSRSFNRLLKDVYNAYPEFAVKSKFTG